MKFRCATLLLTLAVGASLFGQAPQAPPPPPPPQNVPTGIQSLPPASSRDSVAADEVVLTIGDVKLTRAQFEKVKQSLPPQYANMPAQMGERVFAGTYAQLQGLVMLAQREKIPESEEFKNQIAFMRDQLLAQMVVSKLQTQAQIISEAEIKAYYDAHLPEMQQAKVRGILVALNPPAKPGAKPGETPKPRTDDEAKARADALRSKILAGADFAAVAKEESDQQGTAEKGGDFGTVRKGQGLSPALENAVFSLKPNQLSEPVKEGPGYYIFKVEEVKPVTLDEATATIRNKVQQEKLVKSIEDLKNVFPVVYNDKYFGAAPPPPPAPGAAAPPAAGSRPVVTGVAPAKPGATGTTAPPPATPPPAVKKKQ